MKGDFLLLFYCYGYRKTGLLSALIVTGSPYDAPSVPLHKDLGWLAGQRNDCERDIS